MTSRLTRVAAATVAAGLAALLATAAASGPATASPDAGGLRPTEAPAYQQTKHLDRTIMLGDQELEVDSRDVTVTVDRTTQLRGRERVLISWSGARPTGGRAMSPFGENGLQQEYPVVILQCRGVDDPSLPAEQQLSPETCWTSSRMQRVQLAEESEAAWRHDKYATEAERSQKYGLDPIPAECADVPSYSTRFVPFRGAGGKVHPSCTAETMPPEAAVGAAFPPAEMAAFTDMEGNGHAKFEVRSAVENESLGCSDKVACSIVVIPIQARRRRRGPGCRRLFVRLRRPVDRCRMAGGSAVLQPLGGLRAIGPRRSDDLRCALTEVEPHDDLKRTTKPRPAGRAERGFGACGQGRGRTADLPLFRRTLVPTELPAQAGRRLQQPSDGCGIGGTRGCVYAVRRLRRVRPQAAGPHRLAA